MLRLWDKCYLQYLVRLRKNHVILVCVKGMSSLKNGAGYWLNKCNTIGEVIKGAQTF